MPGHCHPTLKMDTRLSHWGTAYCHYKCETEIVLMCQSEQDDGQCSCHFYHALKKTASAIFLPFHEKNAHCHAKKAYVVLLKHLNKGLI